MVIIEIELVYPYAQSMATLCDFCSLWETVLIRGGTHRKKAAISMPDKHFLKIFKESPQRKKYTVPKGMETFIKSLKATDIKK